MKEFINFGCFYQPPIKMEINMVGPAKPERIMWFSMWFLAAIVTFGLAFFPMFYRSIDRRNKHFRRQREIERQTLGLLKDHEDESGSIRKPPLYRNETLWTGSIILVVPVFGILYFLSSDLMLHEKNQQTFLKKIIPGMDYKPQKIPLRIYVLVAVATLGLGGIYWFYRVLNLYNNHFREHQIIDDEISKLMEARSHGKSV